MLQNINCFQLIMLILLVSVSNKYQKYAIYKFFFLEFKNEKNLIFQLHADFYHKLVYNDLTRYLSACKNDIQMKKQLFMFIIYDKSAQISSHYIYLIKYFCFYLQITYDHIMYFFAIKI